MFLIISKWSPKSLDAKVIPLQLAAEIIANENHSADNQTVIPAQYFNKQIFLDWLTAARNLRDFLINDFIEYETYLNPTNNEVITIQMYDNDVTYKKLLETPERLNFTAARQDFLNLINVTMTAKFSTQLLTELPTSYEVVEQMFENASSSLS